jgi:hypothetical protein
MRKNASILIILILILGWLACEDDPANSYYITIPDLSAEYHHSQPPFGCSGWYSRGCDIVENTCNDTIIWGYSTILPRQTGRLFGPMDAMGMSPHDFHYQPTKPLKGRLVLKYWKSTCEEY